MTGAGSASVAFAKEDEFRSLPADPTYYLPGRNITIDDLTLPRALQRMRTPEAVMAATSLAGQIEGALAASWAMSADVQADVRDIVFNDGGTKFETGAAATSRWFVGVDHLAGTAERELKGVIPLEYSVAYSEAENTITESLTMGYADEEVDTAITPAAIQGPTDGNDVPFHGASLEIDAGTVTKLQSATLSIGNIARFQSGPDPNPVDAVIAAPEATLDATAIIEGTDRLELAYGSSGATSTQGTMDSVSGTFGFAVGGSSVVSYDLPKLKPDQYAWQDVVNPDADTTDQTTYHVNGQIQVS